MIREYRCIQCNHLLFKGSLELLMLKRYDRSEPFIEPKCSKCGKMNHFALIPGDQVQKTRESS